MILKTFSLDEDTVKKIDELSIKTKRKKSTIVDIAIEDFYEREINGNDIK